jgi:2-polyprenyl-3-methyl-5-hydroxy-6-metoxy-1,4-benzoquinol methylase
MARAAHATALRRASRPLRLAERAHLAVRLASAPWERILRGLEPEGALLDVGCGPGLLAFLLAREGFAGSYLGVDPDDRKIVRARTWLAESTARSFRAARVEDLSERGFSRVAMVDVLYLVPEEARPALVAACAARLAPGGLLVAVTSGGGVAWKRALDRVQERVAVATGITHGAAVAPCDGASLARLFSGAGLGEVEVRDVGAGYLHGFELVRGRAPV